MRALAETDQMTVSDRARKSGGTSERAIYEAVARILGDRMTRAHTLVDVGCGSGGLWPFVNKNFNRYIGIDVVRYQGMPTQIEFQGANLNHGEIPIPDMSADVTVSVETIEHLENPRAFFRELVRITRPGGLVIVTTPNQLSLLSLVTLFVKGKFSAFQDVHYPAHLTALLEIDLRRIALECGLEDVRIAYSQQGRIALTSWHYPAVLSQIAPRFCSDNIVLLGVRS